MMRMVAFHISHCIDTDKASDERDDEKHQNCKPVHHHMRSFGQICRKLRVQQKSCLRHGKQDRHDPPVLHAHVDDKAHQNDIPDRHQVIHQFRLRIEHQDLSASRDPAGNKYDCCEHNDSGTGIHDDPSCPLVSDKGKDQRHHRRDDDKKWYHCHKSALPLFIKSRALLKKPHNNKIILI